MDAQHECDEGERVEQSRPKKPYTAPLLVALGSFSELTLTVGALGHDDGGRQRGRRSTRA
ncbi:MAG: lasso RiPP family leader peptide-containing protein [Reyranella sp.]